MTRAKGPAAADRPLTFSEYQVAASQTDQTGTDSEDGALVAVLGLSGEAGDLATQFKKKLRDGDSYTFYPETCAEEIGDILWYASTLCSKLGLQLEEVAKKNLRKTKARWRALDASTGRRILYDEREKPSEQIPRQFAVRFAEAKRDGKTMVQVTRAGKPYGHRLTDNAHDDDGYRYHDVFHLAYVAVLGWSPVTRGFLKCKRRSDQRKDEVEDGGRAAVIEEAISALVFQYAEQHSNFDGVGRVDSELLSLIGRLVAGLEIAEASPGDWEHAILEGYKVFRLLNRNKGGEVSVNLLTRSLAFKKLAA